MKNQERMAKIESYGQAYERLQKALPRYPIEMWQFKPSEDEWSIHEILIHITDSEANSYIRCRRFIAEPGSTLMAYNENQWARELHYHDQSVEEALELFRWLRKQSYQLIKSIPESTWNQETYHPESGVITMDDWLETYERHIPEHIAQMDVILERWQQRQ